MKDVMIGQVVISKAGRDKGEAFIVVDYMDPYVFLVDGKLRRIEAPKKKKDKHIQLTGTIDQQIRDQLLNGLKVTNADIRKSLQSFLNDVTESK